MDSQELNIEDLPRDSDSDGDNPRDCNPYGNDPEAGTTTHQRQFNLIQRENTALWGARLAAWNIPLVHAQQTARRADGDCLFYSLLQSNDRSDAKELRRTLTANIVRNFNTKLKNSAGLKIVFDLQNDVKEFLVQQVPIIKIFSNPGLKDRHWSLFNKRLPLPGYDLKELTYGRIKLLYEYEKNLMVLMSISNQAAK